MANADARKDTLVRALERLREDTVTASERIAELAKARGWNEKALASAAGYKSVSTFNNWKMGHEIPKPQNLLEFAVLVGLSVRLLTYDASETIAEDRMANEEVLELARQIERLSEADRSFVKGVVSGLASSRPSEPDAHGKGQRVRRT